ncbi:OmpA family protein [Amaricoccus sp.]|uniref:OmpA family protein n=1 Tax=Amaricoccus sp. TaxID=1872485 RepID=UPI001B5208E3|nr:OmpA family protein [Amaricoccus sp.]MBP7003301.1 OmpA family protein [Amaricoccus sp.]
MTQFRVATLLVLTLAAGCPAMAQEWTDQELRDRFESQIDTFRELGASRGLVLTNRPAAEAPGAAVTTAAPETAPAAESGGAAPALTLAPAGEMPLAATQHVTLPEDEQVYVRVTFAFDSAALAEDQKPALRQLCKAMDAAGVKVFRIIGHTDATGSERYNQQLSVLRAEEVKRFFVDDCGIAPERLQAIGVGKDYPSNAADPYAAENRRVEFQAMS